MKGKYKELNIFATQVNVGTAQPDNLQHDVTELQSNNLQLCATEYVMTLL